MMGPVNSRPILDSGIPFRVYFDTVTDTSADFEFTVYAGTDNWVTRPTDQLANIFFRGVLESYSFTRSIVGSTLGVFLHGTGSLTLKNTDGSYDDLPKYYTPDGQPVTIKINKKNQSHDDAYAFANLTSDGWDIDIDKITLSLRDNSYKLDVQMQTNIYAGSGDTEGGDDIKNKKKPLCFGYAKHVPAVLTDSVRKIYQVNDGAVNAITYVYDRGIALTAGSDYATYALLKAATIAPGYFGTCLAEGFFKLGSTPTGTVTASVQGDTSSGYITTTEEFVRWAITNRTTDVDINEETFAIVAATQPAPVDYWLGPEDNVTVTNFIADLMDGIGGWGGFNRRGEFIIRMLTVPSGEAVVSFTDLEIIGDDITRDRLPDAYTPPPWRWLVPYARCWTQQTDLADGVTDEVRSFVTEQTRLAEASDESVKIDHKFAQEPSPVKAFYTNLVDAQADADRRLAQFRLSLNLYSFTLPRAALAYELGDVCTVTHPRLDLAGGKLVSLVELSESFNFSAGELDTVKVTVYG